MDVFINLFRHVEEDINTLFAEMIQDNLHGIPLEWQRAINDDMSGETKNDEKLLLDEKREFSKVHRGNVLIFEAGSIKMVSSVVGGRKSSIIDLLGKSNIVSPLNIKQNKSVINQFIKTFLKTSG